MIDLLCIFVFPLALPVVSLVVALWLALAYGAVFSRLVVIAAASALMTFLLAPIIQPTGSGSILTPWWYSANTVPVSYVSQYGWIMFGGTTILATLVAIVRGGWRRKDDS